MTCVYKHYEDKIDLVGYLEALKITSDREEEDLINETINMTRENQSLLKFKSEVKIFRTKQSMIQEKAVLGHRILDKIFECYRRTDHKDLWPRSLSQIRGTSYCLASISWHFFGEAIDQEMFNIMKRLNVDDLSRFYFAEWPRREGKTMMICLFNAIVAYVFGGGDTSSDQNNGETVLVYSNGARASKAYRCRVVQILLFLCDNDYTRFQELNQETVSFKSMIGYKACVTKCFPSSPDVSYLFIYLFFRKKKRIKERERE